MGGELGMHIEKITLSKLKNGVYDIIIKDISGSRLFICGDNDAKAIFKNALQSTIEKDECFTSHYKKKSMIKHRK